jgi:hypothetical protein
MKLQADAEHKEDDADLGQLFGDVAVGHKAGRVRTHERAGQQVAHDGREAGPLRQVAEHERGGERAGQRQDEIKVMHVFVPGLSTGPRRLRLPSILRDVGLSRRQRVALRL